MDFVLCMLKLELFLVTRCAVGRVYCTAVEQSYGVMFIGKNLNIIF